MIRIRTGYSFRHAVGTTDAVIKRLTDVGAKVAPITDRASTFGFVEFDKAARAANMKPIFGVELAVVKDLAEAGRRITADYWTFIAKDDLIALNELIYQATLQFHYSARLSYEQALKAKGLIKIAGPMSILTEMSPQDDLYMALAPSTPIGLIRTAHKRRFKFIASGDNLFPAPEDKALYEVIVGRASRVQSYPQYIIGKAEWQKEMEWRCDGDDGHLSIVKKPIEEYAWNNFELVASECTATLPKAKLVKPKQEDLTKLCFDGSKKIGVDLKDKVYKARLDRELNMIKEKGYGDYFLIVGDIVRWARTQMLVGPARGSSCGSLVCYLLGITTIDPLKHDLLFERFIDVNRNDMPDIDIDFQDNKRQEVFDYIISKYGKERVARLGTVNTFQPRSALHETSGAYGIPAFRIDRVIESLIERSSGDARALDTLLDTLETTDPGKELLKDFPEVKIAARMEGHPRHAGQHAAGIVITDKPVAHYVAVDYRTGATMCDKKDAEALGLLKIDALGLTQLSILARALELANQPRDRLEKIPLDDQRAFDIINKRKYAGIFQFNGRALQSLSALIQVDNFNDFAAISALARPGPLVSGGATAWAERKNGKGIKYPHPLFEPFLKKTLGVVAYQEQIMQIARDIGGLSWEDVTKLRQSMSKSLGKEYFDQFGDRFKAGAIKKGISKAILDPLWDDLCAFGAWAFNLSHSVAYGMVSYQCCYCKAYWPHEFAAASLDVESEPERQIKMLRELNDEGIGYIPVDRDLSTDRWQVAKYGKEKRLIGPLSNVNGIGPKMVKTIMDYKLKIVPGSAFPARADKLLANPKTAIDSLWPIRDAFQRHLPDPTARNIHTAPRQVGSIEKEDHDETVMFFCLFDKIALRDLNEEINVAKRGGERAEGQTKYLNLFMKDDTGTIFGRVSARDYESLGQGIVDRGAPNRLLYAIKGTIAIISEEFKMMWIENVRYIGHINKEAEVDMNGQLHLDDAPAKKGE